MKSSTILVAAATFASSAMAAGVTAIGCYKTSAGVTLNGTDDYMSKGKCDTFCGDSPAFAVQFKTCYCGDEIPSDADKVDDSKCGTKCPGYPDDNCGGSGLFYFYNAGIEDTLKKAGSSDSSSADSTNPSQTATAKPSVITVAGKTVTATAAGDLSNTSAGAEKSSGGPNKAGIAAGVVVGAIAISAIAGGIFMFMRNRKRRAIEEEHRRNAAVNTFVAGGKPPMSSAGSSSITDTRLDPVMANRRMSDGSIADNQDYSRRILKVTNA